jgi:CrcB protein
MKLLLAIAGGGALGAVSRFWLSTLVYQWLGRDFPYGTLAVNVIGSLLMGFLSYWLIERVPLSVEWRALILIGFLGSFTTFSTFSLETLKLINDGQLDKALLNMMLSVMVCVGAAWLGLIIARRM